MKKIIELSGRADKGKTITLNYLIGFLDKSKEEKELTKDRSVIVCYSNKKIAVTTPGDNIGEIKKNIEFFEKEDCDILVTATRLNRNTINIIDKYCKENKAEFILTEKNIALTLKDLINQTQAKDIQAKIDEP